MLLHGGPGDNEQTIGRHLSNAQLHQERIPAKQHIPLGPNPEIFPFYFSHGKEEFSSTSYVNTATDDSNRTRSLHCETSYAQSRH